MSDEETVPQYSKMTLRSKRKSLRHLTGGKVLVSREAKKEGAPALRMTNDTIYVKGLEKKAVFQ